MIATVTVLRLTAAATAATSSCECDHAAHQDPALYGPTSRFRAAITVGHAHGARLRRDDTVVTVRHVHLCEHCYLAGHDRAA